MEKVGFRGLMWSRDKGLRETKVEGDGRCVHAHKGIFEGKEATGGRILERQRRVDTHRSGRAAARRVFSGLQSPLRRIGKTCRNKSPRNLSRGQSLDKSHWRLTYGTPPRRLGRSRF